ARRRETGPDWSAVPEPVGRAPVRRHRMRGESPALRAGV
ncbi:MAG: hypothetical protein AVDCRST_MAG83-2612, partial [uncultured Arthrobacter sp.]